VLILVYLFVCFLVCLCEFAVDIVLIDRLEFHSPNVHNVTLVDLPGYILV
jgi:hypothetical protein